MKITFICMKPDMSGGVRVIAKYADLLTEMGHDVTVVCKISPKPTMKATVKRLVKGGARKSDKSHFDNLKAKLVLVETEMPLGDDQVPNGDVVIATWWETAYMVAALSPSKGRKYYFVQHHEVHEQRRSHFSAGSYYLPLKKIAVSGWLVSVMADVYGDHDVDLVANAVDETLFHAPLRDKQAKPTISMMYSRKPFKGTDISLEAVNRARESIPGLHLVAFGTEQPDSALPLPSGATFHFSPPQASLRDIYASSDLYLFGSRAEGFGLPILEAMACGCPVVGTRAGCAPDVIKQGKSGHVVDIDDPEALARAIVEVLRTDNDAWRAMSLAAFDTVKGYGWMDAARRFLACLEEGA